MKSERWQSSKSMLLSFQYFKVELKTERQWAKAGYLPVSEDCGKKLRPSRFSTGSVSTLPRYLLPEEVRAASSDELAEYLSQNANVRQPKPPNAEQSSDVNENKKRNRLDCSLHWTSSEKSSYYYPVCWAPCWNIGRIVIDTETTGLCAGEDEILQLSIISESGKKLFDSYFHPLHRSWSAAQAVNNISPDIVANAPSIAEKAAEIQRILNSADTIIGYNTSLTRTS